MPLINIRVFTVRTFPLILLGPAPICGPGSLVAIVTGYGLDGPGIESRWGEIFRTCPYRPWGPPRLQYNGYRVFPEGIERPGPEADPSPLLVSWSWKGRAIPLLPLWAVRPVQSLSACTRVTFTFTFTCAYLNKTNSVNNLINIHCCVCVKKAVKYFYRPSLNCEVFTPVVRSFSVSTKLVYHVSNQSIQNTKLTSQCHFDYGGGEGGV